MSQIPSFEEWDSIYNELIGRIYQPQTTVTSAPPTKFIQECPYPTSYSLSAEVNEIK